MTDTPLAGVMPPLLVTPEDAARALSIGRTKLYELLRTAELPSVTIGGSRRIRVCDLEALVDALGGQPPPDLAPCASAGHRSETHRG